MDEQIGGLITPGAAEAAIHTHFPCLSAELRPLSKCVGRILRQPVLAERDNPPFDRVCMDGIAIASAALKRGQRRFRIEGTQQAGAPAQVLNDSTAALEVMTGAVLPQACDCVIPLEQYELEHGVAALHAEVTAKSYGNIQRRGEDGQSGSVMLNSGTLLGAAEIAVAASAGLPHLRVSAQPSLMVISAGNDLVEPGEAIAEHQLRRANVYAVIGALRARGFERIGEDHIADDAAVMRERLTLHLATHEVLILSGGVSARKLDYLPKLLQELGVNEIFHRVAQRPGRPMWFGVGPQGQAVFGLPGSAVASLVCLMRYILPAIAAAMGLARCAPEQLALAAGVTVASPLTWFVPVTLKHDAWGQPWAMPQVSDTSRDHLSLSGTDGFIELPGEAAPFERGFIGTVYRWHEVS